MGNPAGLIWTGSSFRVGAIIQALKFASTLAERTVVATSNAEALAPLAEEADARGQEAVEGILRRRAEAMKSLHCLAAGGDAEFRKLRMERQDQRTGCPQRPDAVRRLPGENHQNESRRDRLVGVLTGVVRNSRSAPSEWQWRPMCIEDPGAADVLWCSCLPDLPVQRFHQPSEAGGQSRPLPVTLPDSAKPS